MVMPYQHIKRALMGAVPMLASSDDQLLITPSQIQPASFDFRLGRKAYDVRAGALASNKRVADLLLEEGHCRRELDLEPNNVQLLDRGHTYLVPILESCALLRNTFVEFSPKSSTGRCDVYTRILCDNFNQYDFTPQGYHGPLWAEITPLSFDIGVRAGLSLVQGRFKTPETKRLTTAELDDLHQQKGILLDFSGKPLPPRRVAIEDGEMFFTVDLNREVVGFVARYADTVRQILNLTAEDAHWPRDFWEPIGRPDHGELVLVPGQFYLLVTRERVRVPKSVCGHVLPYKLASGNFQVHYAGFFDNGFDGLAVLEVRARDVPFKIHDGQRICAMAFERTLAVPQKLYRGNYQNPQPSLSKHFKFREEAWQRKHWQAP